jgi:hypothetical protein
MARSNTLTVMERRLLQAIADSEYHDAQDPEENPVWFRPILDELDLGDSAGGVMGSLSRKGLAHTTGFGEDDTCRVTAAGLAALDGGA